MGDSRSVAIDSVSSSSTAPAIAASQPRSTSSSLLVVVGRPADARSQELAVAAVAQANADLYEDETDSIDLARSPMWIADRHSTPSRTAPARSFTRSGSCSRRQEYRRAACDDPRCRSVGCIRFGSEPSSPAASLYRDFGPTSHQAQSAAWSTRRRPNEEEESDGEFITDTAP